MNIQTVKKLNTINKQFYQTIASYFDRSRDYFWEGWGKIALKSYFGNKKEIDVLDLGCGNGRFYKFLLKQFPTIKLNYTGVDQDQTLLEIAKNNIEETNTKFIKSNLVSNNWDKNFSNKFDLIVIFGVLHHIPSYNYRKSLINKTTKLLKQKGYLIFTTWNFWLIPRLKKKIVHPQKDRGKDIFSKLNIKPSELEENDYILDWRRGKTAYRYCHYLDENESYKLFHNTSLCLEEQFKADGKEGNGDTYWILKNSTYCAV
ncbi:methyltransferase domain-containing protein [Candidatus Dojkabacteria bacterium]|nr:methyltransferase domain-containing protein [Candidatus Dojkabacteria bacterium]